jgi:2-dehydro-3-deoxyphosphogluconate aldolase/(4S)-4-hydroxy-2-oxoglutarate aldolase
MAGTDRAAGPGLDDPLDVIRAGGLVPLWGGDDVVLARAIAETVYQRGVRVLEFTLRTPRALKTLDELASWSSTHMPDLVIGAGTVVDGDVAAEAVLAGARFVLSPMIVDDVAHVCRGAGVPYIPGCATVTEMHRAQVLGSLVVKLFPADAVGGPGFLSTVRAACPWVRAIPTGGVEPTHESIEAWLDAGAEAVGLGSALFPPAQLASGDWQAVGDRLAVAVAAVRRTRSRGSRRVG